MEKVKKLRKLLKLLNLDGYIIPKNDEFFGEYIPKHKDRLQFITNFSETINNNFQVLISRNSNKSSFVRIY